MRITTLKASLAGSALAVAALVVPLASAHASAVPKVHGKISFVAVSTSTADNGPSKDVVTGAIVDYGQDHSIGNTNFQEVVLKKGSFEVNAKKLNQNFKVKENAKACTVIGASLARNEPILKGTGAYKGITGSLTLHVTFIDIGKIVKGKCNLNGQPAANTFIVEGSGPVTY